MFSFHLYSINYLDRISTPFYTMNNETTTFLLVALRRYMCDDTEWCLVESSQALYIRFRMSKRKTFKFN